MSPDTLALFSELLGQVQLPASHPDFENQASRIVKAKRELGEAIEAAPES